MDSQRLKSLVALLSVGSNAALVVAKFFIGWTIGSVSVISEAFHSSVDLLAAVIAFAAVRSSGRPADEQHPFGHGKIENLSGTLEAVLIFFAAGWIIYEAVSKLIHPHTIEGAGWGMWVMLGSAVINQAVSHLLFKVGKETDSIALQADAWHLRTDVYTSLGVFAGLGLMAAGEWLVPGLHLHWIDPIAAIGVAILIIHAAFKLTERATAELLDSSLPPEEEAIIHSLLKARTGQVCGYHQLRTRKSGAARFIEFHLLCDGRMTNEESHALAHAVSSEITAKLPQATVTVHVEPCAPECPERCLKGCLLTESERKDSRARRAADGYAGQSTS